MNRRGFLGSILGALGVTVTSKFLSVKPKSPILLTLRRGVDFEFTEAELALPLDEFTRRYINPAITSIMNQGDYLKFLPPIDLPQGIYAKHIPFKDGVVRYI